MLDSVFMTVVLTGFAVAFFHAAIPTHWLPFVLAARIQKWNLGKTLMITALAGGGHVLCTALFGFLVAWCGIALNEKIGALFPWIAGGVLILFGLYYVVRQLRGRVHGHSHLLGEHHHEASCAGEHGHAEHSHGEGHSHHGPNAEPVKRSDEAAIASLFALLTFSPCEGFLPVYVSGVHYGWPGFFLLTVVLSLATLAGMVFFTGLTLAGMDRFKLQFLEKYEGGILGGLLVLLGVILILLEA